MLCQMGSNPAVTTSANSRSAINEKLAVFEMKAYFTGSDLESILADSPKGDRNRICTDDQYLVKCLSYGLEYCTKNFCISKKWWDHRPHISDNTSDLLSYHWSNHFRGIYNKNDIDNGTMKMADNHIQNVYSCHIPKHGGKAFPYLDCSKNKFVSDQIHLVSNTKRKQNAVYLKRIVSRKKAMKEAKNQFVTWVLDRWMSKSRNVFKFE